MLALRDLQLCFLASLTTTPGPEASKAFDPALLRSIAPMDACERAALASVAAGESFTALCAVLEERCGPEAAASEAARFVLRWVDDGILARP